MSDAMGRPHPAGKPKHALEKNEGEGGSVGRPAPEEPMPAGRTGIAEAHLRLVGAIADRYLDRGLSRQELIEAGTVGLLEAAQGFDSGRCAPFSTVASWWIKAAILRALARRRGQRAPGPRPWAPPPAGGPPIRQSARGVDARGVRPDSSQLGDRPHRPLMASSLLPRAGDSC